MAGISNQGLRQRLGRLIAGWRGRSTLKRELRRRDIPAVSESRLQPIFPMRQSTLKRELRRRDPPAASESRLQPIFPMRQSTLKRELRRRDPPAVSESRLQPIFPIPSTSLHTRPGNGKVRGAMRQNYGQQGGLQL